MKNPLETHPLWRQLAIVSIALPLVVILAILAFAWPAARLQPRDLPIGIVGAAPASQLLTGRLEAQPGAFDVHSYADAHLAETAIRQREVYGAFVLTPGQLQVLDASAAGSSVSELLTAVGTKIELAADQSAAAAGRAPITLTTTDVVPLSAKDAKGAVLSSALLPLTICSLIVGAALGLVIRFRPAWRQLVALTAVAGLAGGGIYLLAQGWLGALPHHALAVWATLSLILLALSSATAGLIALIGAPGLGLSAALFVFVGNPFSGVTSAPQLLPGAVDHIGQWLPPGAGANLLRSTTYFDSNGASGHLAVLLAWVLVGFAAIIVGHHGPIRFAAARMNEPSIAG
jgi:hypothetical protein